MRDLDHLRRLAGAQGPAIGAYADAVLDTPLPWTKMRQAYALLGLVKRWGPVGRILALRRGSRRPPPVSSALAHPHSVERHR
jgi:hypothetical protein